jgi:hypothetical protein
MALTGATSEVIVVLEKNQGLDIMSFYFEVAEPA